jgi:hypothetical protein
MEDVGELDGGLTAVEGGPGLRQHGQGLPQLPLRALPFAVLGVDVAAHPVAVGQLGAQPQLAVQLGRLGQGGVGLRDPALGEQGTGHRPVHPGDQRGVAGLRGEGEGELGGLGGAGVGAHVHVRADDAGVQEQQRVGVVQAAAVQLVEGGLQQVDGVPQLARQVVRDGTAPYGRHARRQRLAGQPLLGPLEALARLAQLARLQGAVPQPQQSAGLFGRQPVGLRLREQRPVLLGRLLRPAVGEDALGLGEPQPQVGGEVSGPPDGQLLERDPEPLRDVLQRLVGGAHPPRLHRGDVGRRVGRFRKLTLRQPPLTAQLLHPTPDDLGIVPFPHHPATSNSLGPSCRSAPTPLG